MVNFEAEDRMHLYRLERRQILPIALEEAWTFFSDPRNLPLITPPSLRFRLTCAVPARMHPGMLVTYRLTPFPLFAVRWVTEITHVVEPYLFVDEQRFGPYRFWHHQHHFRSVTEGTEVRDLVSYALPFAFVSRPAAFVVRRQLAKIFDFRRDYLWRRFAANAPATSSIA
jgi:ligand-binding SRPBCC domain-containing protein